MRTLKPIYDYDKYSKPMAKIIYDLFYSEIFKPLFEILSLPESRENAAMGLLQRALREGKLHYEGGFFIGPLNAALSKQLRGIGAVYNKTRKAYKLELAAIPVDIKIAISEGNIKAKEKLDKIDNYLRAIEGRKIKPIELEPFFSDTISGLDKQYHSTTKEITSKEYEIPLEPRLRDSLKEAYSKNLEPYIQDWHDEQVLRLRQQITKNVSKGFRAENLIDTIIQERGVSFNKAKFLAKQETSLMVSKYRQIRYEEAGIRKYQWSTSHDVRVRPSHRALQGQIFDFNNPPVTDPHTMARNNPGEDYGCRCVAIPVLTTRDILEREYVKQ